MERIQPEGCDVDRLKNILLRIDGRGYKAYRDIEGTYDFPGYKLTVEHAQGDPFATPSRIKISVPQKKAGFPPETFRTESRRIALEDYITRSFAKAARKVSRPRGNGNSGLIKIDTPGQEILSRSCTSVKPDRVEVRFHMGLPAQGRRVLGRVAWEMFSSDIPHIVEKALVYHNMDAGEIKRHIEVAEDADHIRKVLREKGLVAFIATGSLLPRASGIDPRPLTTGIKFRPPPELKTTIETPNRGEIEGMGIPEGVVLITGGGYHGKSTLLNAISLGIYNHVPGDGREYAVTVKNAVKIRAEDGRRVEKVDISPFITNLPMGKDTTEFSTENASGSTSQAANIMEAIEAGAELLLIDEDTSATNFMIRDQKMQEFLPKELEPITPFIDRVRQIYEEHGISTIIVVGGSGDYFHVADRVICMINYEPHDHTRKAKEIATRYPRKTEATPTFGPIKHRTPIRLGTQGKTKTRGLKTITFDRNTLDLSAVEQLVDESQTRTIAAALHMAEKYADGENTIRQITETLAGMIRTRGFGALGTGQYAEVRAIDLAMAINRLRTLKVK